MPIQYPAGPIEEHRLVRRSAGLFDTCHMGRIRMHGPGSFHLLDRLLTARLKDLPVGFSRYSLILREDGGVLDDLFVYRLGEEEWFIVVNASNVEKDLAWFQNWASKEGSIQVEDLSSRLGMIALQGPRAMELLGHVAQVENPSLIENVSRPNIGRVSAGAFGTEDLSPSQTRLAGQGDISAQGSWTPPERFGWSWVWIGKDGSGGERNTVNPGLEGGDKGRQRREDMRESTGTGRPAREGPREGAPATPGVRCLLGRTGYTGEDGVEIFPPWEDTPTVWNILLESAKEAGIEAGPAGLAARDSLRFEPGFALYGHELSEDVTPVEASLLWACDLEKPFVGRDAVQKRKAEGPKEKLVTFVMEEQAVPRAGYPVADETGRTVGRVVTGLYAPTLDTFAGNAFVVSDLAGIGKTIYIVVRGALKKARVVKRPLYKPAYRS